MKYENYTCHQEQYCDTAERAIRKFSNDVNELLSRDLTESKLFKTAFTNLYKEFIKQATARKFPIVADGLWGYQVLFDYSQIRLMLLKYREINAIGADGGERIYLSEDGFVMLEVEPKLLTLEEYSAYYEVETKTVVQWIRRGKLRTAKKIGNSWMLPETAGLPTKGGYINGIYALDEDLRPLSEEFPFLNGATMVNLKQTDYDKNKFLVECFQNGIVLSETELESKEKERLEFGLISHPGAHYLPNPYESNLNSVFCQW